MKIDLMETPVLERKMFNGLRHYVSRNDEGKIVATAIGTTSWIQKVVPPSKELDSFKMSFGNEDAYWLALDTMAYYGTILHMVAGELAQGLPITLSDEYVLKMFRMNEIPKSEGGLKEESQHVSLPATFGKKVYNAKRFRKDVIAIKAFFDNIENEFFLKSTDDKNILEQSLTLVGLETTFADFDKGSAGTCDFLYRHDVEWEMKDGSKCSDEFYYIVDLKSGRYPYINHELQLMDYRELVYLSVKNENIRMFDLYMKDYRDETFSKFLNGKSKTIPYNLVEVEYNKEKLHHYFKTFTDFSKYKKPDLTKKDIDYNKPIDDIIKQFKGE